MSMIDGLIVDCFAGGGGASLAIEDVLGRVDIAINHDAKAITMHKANHPDTLHLCENVFRVNPIKVCAGRRVRLAHFSPDCTHHSRAKGGKPVKKDIRGLAWIAIRWARMVRPDIITLENVQEFEDWGPLTECGRPCKKRKGKTFNFWVEKLRRYGYRVEWRRLKACDYGDPTIRTRLFLVARRDGHPIVWPEPTHGPKGSGLKPYRTAAECIDWSIPCPSIFERKRPLVENTLKRIARGIRKFVIEAEEPFIVTYYGAKSDNDFRGQGLKEPLKTQTSENRHALVVPHLSRQFGQGTGRRADGPAPTITPGGQGKTALVSAFLAKHYGGVTGVEIDTPLPTTTARGTQNQAVAVHMERMFTKSGGGASIDDPAPTITSKAKDALVTSHLIKMKGTCRHGQPVDEPMPTVQAGGLHTGEVRAFLMKYYGTGGQWADCKDPMHTLTAKARMGLVMVAGEEYQIVDIGMRMLSPRELFRAHSFPDSYIIDPLFEGKPLTKTDQVAKVGNSVARKCYRALLEANVNATEVADEAVA